MPFPILPVFMLFVLAKSSLGQTWAFAIFLCVFRIMLILVTYVCRANIIQIISSRSTFCLFFLFFFFFPILNTLS